MIDADGDGLNIMTLLDAATIDLIEMVFKIGEDMTPEQMCGN